MSEVWIRAAHFVAIILMASSLFGEHLLLRREMAAAEMHRLAKIDALYGLSAIAVAGLGGLLWLGGVGKPSGFYSGNPVFHAKLSLFVFIALLSIYPTVFFLRHRRTHAERVAVPRAVVLSVRVQLACLCLMPVLAVVMARGIGFPH